MFVRRTQTVDDSETFGRDQDCRTLHPHTNKETTVTQRLHEVREERGPNRELCVLVGLSPQEVLK